MAKLTANVKKMDELIDNLTECRLCKQRMSNPKFLPCSHTFCCHCIRQLCQSQSSRSIPCPLCRSLFVIPESGNIGRMPTNVYVEELIRVNTDSAKMEASLSTATESCQKLRRQLQQTNEELTGVNTALLEARRKLAALEYEMEAEKFQKAMTDAEASLSTAKESCQKVCQQPGQTNQGNSKLANTLQKLGKLEKEMKSLKDKLPVDKQKQNQTKVSKFSEYYALLLLVISICVAAGALLHPVIIWLILLLLLIGLLLIRKLITPL